MPVLERGGRRSRAAPAARDAPPTRSPTASGRREPPVAVRPGKEAADVCSPPSQDAYLQPTAKLPARRQAAHLAAGRLCGAVLPQ
jgi:hypothetical protein